MIQAIVCSDYVQIDLKIEFFISGFVQSRIFQKQISEKLKNGVFHNWITQT